ncbi:MAG: TIGR03089 family protein [Nocardioidaceae bacterium]
MPIPQLLADATARDPGRPLLTFYDHASGERVELSRATMANWVAKTANMLQDSLAAASGTSVAIDLPAHWERAVWLLAAWEVGCVVELGRSSETHDIAVVGPAVLDGELPYADETVALSLRPLGGRFTDPLPPGVIDFNAEVLGHGDVFAAYDVPTSSTRALVLPDGSTLDHRDCVAAAERRAGAWDPSPRLLTGGGDGAVEVVELLLGPLAADGSLVLVANPQQDRLDRLTADEHVTVMDKVNP